MTFLVFYWMAEGKKKHSYFYDEDNAYGAKKSVGEVSSCSTRTRGRGSPDFTHLFVPETTFIGKEIDGIRLAIPDLSHIIATKLRIYWIID